MYAPADVGKAAVEPSAYVASGTAIMGLFSPRRLTCGGDDMLIPRRIPDLALIVCNKPFDLSHANAILTYRYECKLRLYCFPFWYTYKRLGRKLGTENCFEINIETWRVTITGGASGLRVRGPFPENFLPPYRDRNWLDFRKDLVLCSHRSKLFAQRLWCWNDYDRHNATKIL